jgi:hypothetical protein
MFKGFFPLNNTVAMQMLTGLPGANGPTVTIHNGSGGLNTRDFYFLQPVFFTLNNYHAEQSVGGGSNFLQIGSDDLTNGGSAFASAVLNQVDVHYVVYTDDIALKFHLPGKYTVINSQFADNIAPDKAQLEIGAIATTKSELTVINSTLQTTSTVPIIAHANNNALWKVALHGVQLDTGLNAASSTMTDDRIYLIDSDNNENTISSFPWGSSYAALNGTNIYPSVSGMTWLGLTFANLPSSSNGTTIYCSDCTFANPCAGSGTGAIAKRLNGAWRCD